MSSTRSRLLRGALWLLLSVVALVLVAAAYGGWVWTRQGLDVDELAAVPGTTVEVDEWGVPTISGSDWDKVIEAQGYVHAANRLWQMELMRRAGAGGLSELFGQAAVEADTKRLMEDWPGVAQRLADALPEEEAQNCASYTAGVNRFIESARGRWGIEFAILRTEPAPWTCRDSMLVLMGMGKDLSSAAEDEGNESLWRDALDPEWEQLLFPVDHPWNHPLFGENPRALHLPSTPLKGGAPEAQPPGDTPLYPGSNSWAWRGESGAFLANDPHLGANVPHLWYMNRLRVSSTDWEVGVSIPGMPLIVLGMNPGVAWSFTNVGEDVDDWLLEEVSPDGKKYLRGRTTNPDGTINEDWALIERREHTLKVKGEEPRTVVGLHTVRGPLERREALGGAWASRQWLPFQDPAVVAHVATIHFRDSRTLDEMSTAIERFRFPAQNVVVMDRAGNIMYQASGTGVVRRVNGDRPVPALEGAWTALAPTTERPRMRVMADEPAPAWIVTANARIWVGPFSERWGSDRRTERIREVLASRADFSREDMERLQLDTRSRYHQILLEWAVTRHPPKDDGEAAMMARWKGWDGFASTDPQTFTEALAVEATVRESLLDQVRREALPPDRKKIAYAWSREDAWILLTLGVPEDDSSERAVDWAAATPGFDRFGLNELELATAAVRAANQVVELYPVTNRWIAQHPFVGRVPVIGDWFKIGSPEQVGYANLVRSEKPKHGASVRFVWDLRHPEASTWITPVGQSGHVRSAHFSDLQPRYSADQRLPVFDKDHDWGFGG